MKTEEIKETKEEKQKMRKINMKLFPIYKALSWDLLFYYTINFLFFLNMFYSISLCTLILTYFLKNKSTINENVIWIFCIICHFNFCVFFCAFFHFFLFHRIFTDFCFRIKKQRGQKDTNLFNLFVFRLFFCFINLTQ